MTKAKWNYIFGALTITVIVGGTIYAIKKSKEAEKAEEESISVEEAMAMVAREREDKESVKFETPIETVTEEELPYKMANLRGLAPSMTVIDEEIEMEEGMEELEEDDPLRDDYPLLNEYSEAPSVEPLLDFKYFEDGINPKEDRELRHDPNSYEAKHQYIRMELADWQFDHDTYRILIQLFEFPLIPTTTGDELLRTQVIDYKVQFFGFSSKWVKEISFAEIILHYARVAAYNCGETVAYWVEYFLDFNEFEWDSTSRQIETLLLRLASHTYFNEERQTFGLFGLTRESMDQAIRIANGNVDRSVTFEIEFQEFLKSCI